MHAEITTSLESPDMQSKLDAQGAVPEKMSSPDFGKLMVDETNKWLDVIKRAGIKGE
jgi:tripartite-type tricarboxylate transporter receptor subunit TctC